MMPQLLPRLVVPLAGLLLAACGGDTPARRGALRATVDTVGDTIVVRTIGDVPAAEALQLVEVWRAGSDDGDEATSFSRVHSLDVSPQGDVYVFEAGGPQFRRYDASGGLRRTLGRKGSGPGEFAFSNGVAVLRDGRIVLWDGLGNSRLNVYAAADSFLYHWSAPVTGFSTYNQSLLALTDGGLAARAFVRDTTRREALGRVAWYLYRADGRVRDTILWPDDLGADEVLLVAQSSTGRSSRPVPYSRRAIVQLHPAGHLIWSPGVPYLVHTRLDGRPLRIERSSAPVPVNDEERRQRREQVIWGMRQTDPDWSWNGPDIPREKPPVQDLFVALDGQLLVTLSTPSEPFEPDPPRTVEGQVPPPLVRYRATPAYELFRPDGTLRGRFTLPRGATVHALRGDDVWGTVTDADDVPYLVRWRIEDATR
jgi:hypothetical protein